MELTDIKSLSIDELKEQISLMGDKAFRAKQIYDWLHVKLVDDFDEMTNLSKELKEQLKNTFQIVTVNPIEVQTSKLDGTQKYLFQLQDGNVIESVLMKYKHGNSVCISSQVGCKMGCRFCASTIGGLERNLTTSEMLSQIYVIQRMAGERVSNVVVMGTGEPMDNYDNFIRFVKMLSDENGLNISQRNITVSTCGLVPRMRQLAEEKLQITLALSLHATTDEKRKALMPIANKYSLEEVLDACNYYFEQTGRRITFEYSLVGGVNDTKEDAEELIKLVKHVNCHVNLIPVNPIKERDYVQSNKKVIDNFKNKLEKCQINVTIRREMGRDIDGACGQLRKSYQDRNAERKL
ncbi:23S rRNA (adenine(2503)-C(2))-methyltransferase RlmN [Candidatus Galacturonibacter soehngenii]|uniref:Probable dual-specificity RNA methyltransferase RlmN n=1 Tax=Candidatus Galacturonatibacter soehngenii TaxID=2307010 RepID=A0A7V7QNR2_9FIRM|nr:23S rRNA (adenine(2503)-C(2))-methyltransferase RlmN [Candidatus Galacturonibacter soehngenii]KAB1440711.1 23S rRNA (adenine(2503)-C(2))-methyltransferase RlmN [Candidatus Galacturonibacter soehngenii]